MFPNTHFLVVGGGLWPKNRTILTLRHVEPDATHLGSVNVEFNLGKPSSIVVVSIFRKK